jgi:diguanylate cyclase (GGDEF)-like protein
MRTRISKWFESPYFPGNEEKTNQARLMHTLGLYFVSALIIAAITLVPLFVVQKIATWAIIIILLIVFAISRYLMYQGKVKLAGALMVASAWALFEGMAIIAGGINSPMLFAVAAATIIIGLLFQARVGGFFVVASILAGLGMAALQQTGFDLPRFFAFEPLVTWFLFALALAFMNSTMNLVVRKLENALALARTLEVQLRHQSTHDALTGVYNRAFFEEELARLERSRDFPVSIIVADVDDLKIVNDTQGHAVGDELLRRATSVLRTVFRASDVLARIGGDEFAVLLPRTDAATAAPMVSRVQTKLTEHSAKYPDLPVQLSLGASTAEQSRLVEAFIVADQRMYADKAMRKAKATQSNNGTGKM